MKPVVRIGAVMALTLTVLVVTSTDIPWGSLTRWPFGNPPPRVDVYEALIRHLAVGRSTVYVRSDICSSLLEEEGGWHCADRLDAAEQGELRMQLRDLGEIAFVPEDVTWTGRQDGGGACRVITLGPIKDDADGTRVEGSTYCGNVCGYGAVYVLGETDDGYEVTGEDETYGAWIS